MNTLWSHQDASGPTHGAGMDAAQRFHAELGYGVEGRKGWAVWAPFVATERFEAGQTLRVGLRLTSDSSAALGLESGRR